MKNSTKGIKCRRLEGYCFLRIGVLVLASLILGSCTANLLPTKDVWYMQHYIIMQDFERAAYKNFSDEGKMGFQALFWEERIPESKQIFMQRLDFVTKNFKRENSKQPWNCDRARIFILNGSPASVDYAQNDSWGMTAQERAEGGGGTITRDRGGEDIQARTSEVWTYQHENNMIKYFFAFSPPNKWKLAQGSFAGNRYLGDLENWSRQQVFGPMDLEEYKLELEKLQEIK
jgi:GWxTD domain-containing protein